MHLRDRRRGDRHSSNDANSAVERLPELGLDQRARLFASGNGGSRSCNAARSSAISSPSRSARVDSICPSLMKLGPSSFERGGEPLAGTGRRLRSGGAGRCARHAAAAPRRSAGRAETARRGAPASRRSGRGGRDCGNCGSDRTRLRPRRGLRAAKPNAARRCRRSGCGIAAVRDPRPRSSRRPRSAAGTGGCSRPDRRRRRGRRSTIWPSSGRTRKL